MENKRKSSTQAETVSKLAEKIRDAIVPLIDRDYVLFGLPYYSNIGDTLIWEGERELLKQVKYKCVGVCGWTSYPAEPLARKDVAILITGGGYMGDVWRYGWEQVLKCMSLNPDNKIIVLPNTLHYSDKATAEADAAIMARCRDLTLCMRDVRSLELAREYFPGIKSILVPDMAFCINPHYLDRWSHQPSKGALLLKRLDKELPSAPIPDNIISQKPDVRDWPTMEQTSRQEVIFDFVRRVAGRLGRMFPPVAGLYDCLYEYWYRPMMTRYGVQFLSDYSKIYTTRLHVGILGVLLGKEVYVLDNSYGKLSSFFTTWLNDCENTHILQS